MLAFAASELNSIPQASVDYNKEEDTDTNTIEICTPS
jgi:hypothetical protein